MHASCVLDACFMRAWCMLAGSWLKAHGWGNPGARKRSPPILAPTLGARTQARTMNHEPSSMHQASNIGSSYHSIGVLGYRAVSEVLWGGLGNWRCHLYEHVGIDVGTSILLKNKKCVCNIEEKSLKGCGGSLGEIEALEAKIRISKFHEKRCLSKFGKGIGKNMFVDVLELMA